MMKYFDVHLFCWSSVRYSMMSYWKMLESTHFLLTSKGYKERKKIKAYGQLVLLGFDVTTFTPVAYQRHSL